MKKSFILIFCTVVFFQIKAQNIEHTSISSSFSWVTGNGNQPLSNPIDNIKTEDRFFVDSAFRQGELRTRKGLFTTEFGYRFDQFEGTIEVKMESGKTMYLEEKEILYCKLFVGNKVVTFMPVALPNEQKLTLLQVVYKTPTLQLYRSIRKIITTQTRGDDYISKNLVHEIVNDYHYYVRKGDRDLLQEVEITAKSFSTALPDREDKIARLFKEEKKKKDDFTLSELCTMMGKLDKKPRIE